MILVDDRCYELFEEAISLCYAHHAGYDLLVALKQANPNVVISDKLIDSGDDFRLRRTYSGVHLQDGTMHVISAQTVTSLIHELVHVVFGPDEVVAYGLTGVICPGNMIDVSSSGFDDILRSGQAQGRFVLRPLSPEYLEIADSVTGKVLQVRKS